MNRTSKEAHLGAHRTYHARLGSPPVAAPALGALWPASGLGGKEGKEPASAPAPGASRSSRPVLWLPVPGRPCSGQQQANAFVRVINSAGDCR